MIKARNKKISLLIAIVFVMTLVLPMGTAFAAGNFALSSYAVKILDDDNNQNAGWVKIKDLDLSDADTVYVSVTLPDDVVFEAGNSVAAADLVTITNQAGLEVAFGADPDEANAYVVTDDEDEILFWVKKAALVDAGDYDDANIFISFNANGALDLSDLADGDEVNVDVEVTGVMSTVAVWTETETVLVGAINDVDVAVSAATPVSVKAGATEQKIAEITIKEGAPGQIVDGDEITFILPNNDDFQWSDPESYTVDPGTWGLGADYDLGTDFVVNEDGDELTVEIYGESATKADELSFTLKIDVMPNADEGDIEIEVTSDDDIVDDTELVVARIGDTEGEFEVDLDDADDIYPANYNMTIGTITVTSSGTFADGDDIFMELSEGCEWYFDGDPATSVSLAGGDVAGVKIYEDGAGLWLTVVDPAPDLDEIELEGLTIATLPDAPVGDITVTFSGVVEGSAKVAEISPIATVSADKPSVKIGLGQAAGTITITEADDETLPVGDYVYLELPKGVSFSAEPTVEVNDTEVASADITLEDDDQVCVIDLGGETFRSAKADSIVVSDIELDVDERVAFGDISVDISGEAVNALWDCSDYEDEADDVMFSVAVATLVDSSIVVKSFKVGDPGVTVLNGRTLVQVNTLCEALGLQKSWDAATQTAYFFKDGKVVAFPIGKNQIVINGFTMPVDQGGVTIGGATYATLRGLQYAFGGYLAWDAATKTATFEFPVS